MDVVFYGGDYYFVVGFVLFFVGFNKRFEVGYRLFYDARRFDYLW